VKEPREPLVGYMIFEDWLEDMSDWSGQITGPGDPTGANLAWESPIKMIEHSAYDTLRSQLELERKANRVLLEGLKLCRHEECIDPHFIFNCRCPKCKALDQERKLRGTE